MKRLFHSRKVRQFHAFSRETGKNRDFHAFGRETHPKSPFPPLQPLAVDYNLARLGRRKLPFLRGFGL